MPLITITTTREYQPADDSADDTEKQGLTAHFGESLPRMIFTNLKALHLDPEDTPEGGVQVDYDLYHPRAVNAADIWIEVQFAEDTPDVDTRKAVRAALRALILDWFESAATEVPDLAVDVFWGPSHGFLRMGETDLEW